MYLIDVLPAAVEPSTTTQRIVCFLTLSTPEEKTDNLDGDGAYQGSRGKGEVGQSDHLNTLARANSLSTVYSLGKLIQDGTDVPIPKNTLDTSLRIVPYHYLVSSPLPIPQDRVLLSLSEARRQNLLSSTEDARFDLRIGQYLGQLHVNVQNDWFGIPQSPGQANDPALAPNGMKLSSFLTMTSPPPGGDGAYSWQETFVALFEDILSRVEERLEKGKTLESDGHIINGDGISKLRLEDKGEKRVLPSQDIHRYLARAISFYLFEDVEVPSLVTLTGSADDVFVTLCTPSQTPTDLDGLPPRIPPLPEPEIACILPSLAHALWGDPLIETMFTPPGPSEAVLEGYAGAGGGPLILFPRQKTKRLWYTLFSTLLMLAEGMPLDEDDTWEMVEKCTEALKDAPCY